MKRSDEDIDTLLRNWDRVASTARRPAEPPRRTVITATAFPVPLLVVAALAIVAVALVARGGPGPAASASPSPVAGSPTPAAATATATPLPSAVAGGSPLTDVAVAGGDLELRLTVERGEYVAGEDILAQAAVTYLGPDPTVQVWHAWSPVLFKVVEVGGDRAVGGPMPIPCLTSTWPRDDAQVFPWARSGSYSAENPTDNDRFTKAYLEDGPPGGLRLPAGTWELSVTLGVERDVGCSGSEAGATASVTITVDPAATVSPTRPAPTPAQLSPDVITSGSALRDPFKLTLAVDQGVYRAGDDIFPVATVIVHGSSKAVTVGHGGSAVTFSVHEVGGSREAIGGTDTVCLRSTWTRGEPQVFTWQRGGSWSLDNPTPNDRFVQAYAEQGPRDGLWLPAGTWELSATLDVNVGDCGPSNPLTATVRIRVVGDPTASPSPGPG